MVVASIAKLLTLWNVFHISWLEGISEEPWAVYGVPLILILVGSDQVYHSIKGMKHKED